MTSGGDAGEAVAGLAARLDHRLRVAFERTALTVLIAPAGYGKSSAISRALSSVGRPAARYTAQRWHAGDFVEPLVAEIRAVRADFGRLTLATARQPSGSGGTDEAWVAGQRAGAAFARELGHIGEPIVVTIEDAHLFEGDRFFAGFTIAAVRTLPAHAHLVVETRVLPEVPLAEWIVQGRAVAFETGDLRLDAGDIVHLAARAGISLELAPAAALGARFDGWAAGLALHFAAGPATVPSSAGPLPAVTAYLLDGAIEALAPPLRAFLEATAVYETLDRSVLERDDELAEVPERLHDLERSGAMFSAVQPGERYRLHPLLRDALLARVRSHVGGRALEARHTRAATVLESLGLIAPALYHREQSRDDHALRAFLERQAYRLFIAGLGERAARIAGRLLLDGVDAGGVASQFQGMLARQRGEPGAADAFAIALAAATSRGDAPWIETLRLLVVEERIARGEHVTPADLQAIAGAAASPGARVEAELYAGWAAALRHALPEASASARAATDLAGDAIVARTRMNALAAYVQTALGDFTAADALLAETLRALEGGDHVVLLANTLVWYARLALIWGDVVAARDYATQGRALAHRIGLGAELAGVDLALAEIAAHEGDLAACERSVAAARSHGDVAWYFADRARMRPLAARALMRATFACDGARAGLALARLAGGDRAIPLARRAAITADTIAYAVLAGERRPPELAAFAGIVAAAAVDDLLDALTLAQAVAIVAIARATLGLAAEPALPLAVEQAYGQLFAADPATQALRAAASGSADAAALATELERRGPSFPVRLIRALRPGATARPAAAVASPLPARHAVLTPRESEVLVLLAQGLTNKEMAQRLSLSPRTIDTHVERVLAKLGVTSRTRAVAAALRSGLVAAT